MGEEARIERAVCDYAESRGCLVRKFVSPGNKFVPDRIFFPKGKPAFLIEFKSPGAELRPGQFREIERLRANGHAVLKCDDKETGMAFVDANT